MKKILFLALCSSIARGQNNIIPNPGFESISGSPQCLPAFSSSFNGFVHHWESPNGNQPEFIDESQCSSTPFCTSTGASRYVTIRSFIPSPTILNPNPCNNRVSSSVAVALVNGATFSTSKTYVLRYKFRNVGGSGNGQTNSCDWTLTHNVMRVWLSDRAPWNWRADNNLDLQHSAEVTVSGVTPGCGWQMAERTFQPLLSGKTTIAFEAWMGGFQLDDVEVFEMCDNNYLIQNKTFDLGYGPGSVLGANHKDQAGSILTAGSNVGASNGIGPVVVGSTSRNVHVIFTAQQEIRLKDGFRVFGSSSFPSTEFHAVIDPSCPNFITQRTAQDEPLETGANDIADADQVIYGLKIYPNPVQDQLTVEVPENVSYVLVDVLGRQLLSGKAQTGKNTVDLSACTPGVYYLQIESHNANNVTRIIKN